MIKAAVLGSPISHSLSPLLHHRAYELLKIDGEYSAIDTPEDNLMDFLSNSLTQLWAGFNLTMPLKERVFDSALVHFDELSTRIRSANTLIRSKDGYEATSTDATAFDRFLANFPVDRVALIGGGGTARAAVSALASRSRSIDLILRTPSRSDPIKAIAPSVEIDVLDMTTPLKEYDLIINTTPVGVADIFAQRLDSADGLYFESLYNPLPTELSFAWNELGGKSMNGIDLLVEQALDAIHLMTKVDFDYSVMRQDLLKVAISHIAPQD